MILLTFTKLDSSGINTWKMRSINTAILLSMASLMLVAFVVRLIFVDDQLIARLQSKVSRLMLFGSADDNKSSPSIRTSSSSSSDRASALPFTAAELGYVKYGEGDVELVGRRDERYLRLIGAQIARPTTTHQTRKVLSPVI